MNGLDGPSVVQCDHVATVPSDRLGPQIGLLLAAAIRAASDLD